MKTLHIFLVFLLFTGYTSGLSSCTIVFKKDNGKHKGWFKRHHHPHGPKPWKVKHPGNGNGNGKNKKK